mgnify:CR=1 FL=1
MSGLINPQHILNIPVIVDHFNPRFYFHELDYETVKKNNKRLMMTDIGKYSITKPQHTIWIKKQLITFFKEKHINTKTLSLIDCNAGLGGDTISFSKYFKHVYAIEKNDIHFHLLKNNCDAIGLKNIDFKHSNFFDIIKQKEIRQKYNILFLDPPWGGPNYKKYESVNLEIELGDNKRELHEVVNELFPFYSYIILKSPINLKFEKDKFKYKNVKMIKEENNKILLIIFQKDK